MYSKKRYTNETFTKRVDHEAGRHRPARASKEPAVCIDCGAVYVNRRWSAANSAARKKYHDPRPHMMKVCPACKQQREGQARGFVFIDGDFLRLHKQEVKQLLQNEVNRASEDNPLGRILEWSEGGKHQLQISTTTEHLAQRLGHALEKAYGGNVEYDFSHENKLARVSWRRE